MFYLNNVCCIIIMTFKNVKLSFSSINLFDKMIITFRRFNEEKWSLNISYVQSNKIQNNLKKILERFHTFLQ